MNLSFTPNAQKKPDLAGPQTRFFKVALFAQKTQADPNFLHHLEGPRGCFQNLKKKFRNFFKILDFGPENAKM